jgi:hypothetical protein
MTRLARELNQLLCERNKAEAEVAALQVVMCMFECTRVRERERETEEGRDRRGLVCPLYASTYLAFLCMLTNHSSKHLKARLTRVQLESLMGLNRQA